jgi:serine protease Do
MNRQVLRGFLWAGLLAPMSWAQPAPRGFSVVLPGAGGAYLGLGVRDVDASRAGELKLPEAAGVEVTSVEDNSPASRAGLRVGDVVLRYGGEAVRGIEQLVRLVRETPVGRTAAIAVWRSGAEQSLTATIARRESDTARRWRTFQIPRTWIPDIPRPYTTWRSSLLGIEAESVEGQLADYFGVKEGILVRSVFEDSVAERAGVKAGDVVVRIGDTDVETPRELSEQLRSLRLQRQAPLTVKRDRKDVTLNLDLSADSARPEPSPARGVSTPQ